MWYVAYFATGAWLIVSSSVIATIAGNRTGGSPHVGTRPPRLWRYLWLIPIVALWPICIPIVMGELLRRHP